LTPRLALPPGSEPQLKALRQLMRNSMIEIVLGLMIFSIVGLLGMLHPAIHFRKFVTVASISPNPRIRRGIANACLELE